MEGRSGQGRELGQAKQRFSWLMSLRDDSGRLSLESVLSATALGLALPYLINDSAAASPLGAGPHPAGSGPSSGGELPTAAGGTNAIPDQQGDTTGGIQRPDPSASLADPARDPNGRLIPLSGLGGWFQPHGTVDLDTARNAIRGADGVSLAAGSSALASSDGSVFRSGSRPQSLASRSGADSTLPAEAAAPENPLAHLLAGMNVVALNGQQLAIAAGPNNSTLLRGRPGATAPSPKSPRCDSSATCNPPPQPRQPLRAWPVEESPTRPSTQGAGRVEELRQAIVEQC